MRASFMPITHSTTLSVFSPPSFHVPPMLATLVFKAAMPPCNNWVCHCASFQTLLSTSLIFVTSIASVADSPAPSLYLVPSLLQNANSISSADYFERDEHGTPLTDDADLSAADLVNRLSYQVGVRKMCVCVRAGVRVSVYVCVWACVYVHADVCVHVCVLL